MSRVLAFSPGGIGNLGPGLDILGCVVTGPGDAVEAERRAEPGIVVAEPGHPELPADPERHTAGLAVRAVLRLAGAEDAGLVLRVEKGLPLSGGQGGSAATAAAAAVAVNTLLGSPLGAEGLILACLAAEEKVSGRHADNLAPMILGGVTLVRSLEPLDVVRLPVPAGLFIVLAHPAYRLRTAEGRSVLPRTLDRGLALHQAANIAAMTAAFASGDLALLGRALDDRIAEPARAPLLPGFREAKAAALAAGALGCSISGSGPTAFALVGDEGGAAAVASAMEAAYRAAGHDARARVCTIDPEGARIVAPAAAREGRP